MSDYIDDSAINAWLEDPVTKRIKRDIGDNLLSMSAELIEMNSVQADKTKIQAKLDQLSQLNFAIDFIFNIAPDMLKEVKEADDEEIS